MNEAPKARTRDESRAGSCACARAAFICASHASEVCRVFSIFSRPTTRADEGCARAHARLRARTCARFTSLTRLRRFIPVQNPYHFHAYAPSARPRLRARAQRARTRTARASIRARDRGFGILFKTFVQDKNFRTFYLFLMNAFAEPFWSWYDFSNKSALS